MRVVQRGDAVAYHSRRKRDGPAELQVTYRHTATSFSAASGSIDHFLTERYCLYNVDRRGRPYRLDIHHPPWRLQLADATFGRNTMAEAAGIALPGAPVLHYAERQDMVAWYPVPIGYEPRRS